MGLTYADIEAVTSVFQLAAKDYVHRRHARAMRQASTAKSGFGAPSASARTKEFLHRMGEREEELRSVLPRLSLLLRVNHALGGLPSDLAAVLDPDASLRDQHLSSGDIAAARGKRMTASPPDLDDPFAAVFPGDTPSKASRAPTSDPVKTLTSMGITLYSRDSPEQAGLGWDALAGYEHIQREVEASVLLPMEHPELYDAIAQRTRAKPEANNFGAFVFTGPPGVGKTLTARIVAAQVQRPLVVLSFEQIGSSYYSQSEANLAKVFDAVTALPGSILFIDEADAMFPSR